MAVSPVRLRQMMSHRSIIPPDNALPRRAPMLTSGQTEARKRHDSLKHPIIDADGHWAEFAPLMREEFRRIGGDTAVEALAMASQRIPNSLGMSVAERRRRRIGQEAFWFLPTKNTLDRATAMMPRLLYERLDDLGLDFCVVYPTAGLGYYRLPPEKHRRALCRAYNVFTAEQFRPFGDRIIPAAIIPMYSPEEAIEEREFASKQPGLRVVMGHFASAGEAMAKALFFVGVTRRFPELNFAFLEGGVGWACSLYADLIGHWEKRNREALENTNPARLDRAVLLALVEKYGKPAVVDAVRRGEGLDDNGDGTGGVEDLDDYSRCKIARKEDFRDLYVSRFYFGCEADDPINAWAFNRKANPLNVRLNAFFSADIAHFDVPDMTEVVPEAYELVEHGLLTDDDFRDFMFTNAVRFWGEVNPDFFKGTVVEKQAAEVLARSRSGGGPARPSAP